MDYFSPELFEIKRQATRLVLKALVALRMRELAKAETDLGLLGWQQADYDPPTQKLVQEIYDVEKEQSRLTNEAAELFTEIKSHQEKRQAARTAHEEERRQFQDAERKIREPRAELERQLAEKRRLEPTIEKRIPAIDRELREVQKQYQELLATEQHTPETRNELILLRERTVALPNEKHDLKTDHLRILNEIKALEHTLAKEDEKLAELHREQREADARWSQEDHQIAAEIRLLERTKEGLEKQIHKLEAAKENPYQRIGHVLAEHGIAPLNQPDALHKVHRLKTRLSGLQQQITDSEAASAAARGPELTNSQLVWIGIASAFILILLVSLL